MSEPYTVEDFDRDLEAGPYAWPGGYPKYFLMDDGEALSFAAAKKNADLIREAIRERDRSGWQAVGCDINWEDSELFCADTGERIEAAYGED